MGLSGSINEHWSETETESVVKCRKCKTEVKVKDAGRVGCTNTNCTPKVALTFPMDWINEECKHKFVRNPDGPPSTKKVIGVYNVSGETERDIKAYSGDIPPKPENCVRIVCVSDTHEEYPKSVPDGDILIHAGDFTYRGAEPAVIEFNKWLGSLPHKHKIVIAGNHDISFDIPHFTKKWWRYFDRPFNAIATKNLLTNCTYLEDSETTVCGLRIYGSPWQPFFGDWAFNVQREEIAQKWKDIPTGIDVLVTHGPPVGHGGTCHDDREVGCEELLKAVNRTMPVLHVAGHVHEGYGVSTAGGVYFVNASTVSRAYIAKNRPVVVDVGEREPNE